MKIQINRRKKNAMSIYRMGITLFTTIPIRLKMILFIVTRGRKKR